MADPVTVSLTIETDDGAGVPFATVAEKFKIFADLLAAIEKEVIGLPVHWITDLVRMGSVEAVLRVEETDFGERHRGERVADTLTTVAQAAANGDLLYLSWPAVREQAGKLTSDLPTTVPGVRIGARGQVTRIPRELPRRNLDRGIYLSTITGVVHGLNIHQDPRFTLYDDVSGAGFRCHLAESDGQIDLKELLGKRIAVRGVVTPGTPSSISRIEKLTVLEPPVADYTRTRGILRDWQASENDLLATLRQVRRGE